MLRRWRKTVRIWLLRLVPTIALIAISLVLAEVVLRWRASGQPRRTVQSEHDSPGHCEHDELLGWRLAPLANGRHKTSNFDVAIRINRHGLRADREYSYERRPHVARVVVVGDSFTFGHGVEAEETYAALLERWRPATEVLNLGVQGFGTDQQLLILRSKGLRYHPDLVIMGLYKGDVFRNTELSHGVALPKPMFELDDRGGLVLTNVPVPQGPGAGGPPLRSRGILDSSLVYQRLSSPTVSLVQHLGYGECWEVTEAIVRETAKLADRAGARFLVLILPSEGAIYGGHMVKGIQRRTVSVIAEMLTRSGVEHLDVTPALAARAAAHPEEPLYFVPDGHFTPAGHRAVAEAVQRFLSTHPTMAKLSAHPEAR